MKSHLGLLLGITLLTGCLPINQDVKLADAQLTPWHTASAISSAPTEVPEFKASTSTPAPTPTPTIHVVALGETISSIAQRYRLDMNTLMAANPEIDPYSLIVGDQVIIPAKGEMVQNGGFSEPLALDLSQPECFHTPEGGLWCFAILFNPLNEAAANLAVTIKVLNASSEEIDSHTVPAILNKLDPGQSIPVSAYFTGPVPAIPKVTASLASAFPASQSGKTYFPVDTGSPTIEISGRLAKVSGEAVTAADPGKTVDVWVAALAYDKNGSLVGIRRMENRVTLEQGKGVKFNLYVYSSGGVINSVTIKAEAMPVNE